MATARNIGGWLGFAWSGRIGLDGARDDQTARRLAQEVFPGLGFALMAGLVLGAATGVGLAWLQESHWRGAAGYSAAGALAGAILGTFLGLSRAVWRPGALVATLEPPAAVGPEARLWDSWLDTGHDLVWVEPADQVPLAVPSPAPQERSRIRPRVLSNITGEPVLLHDEIAGLIERGESGTVAIVGGPGSGKTTALEHLETVLPPWADVRLLDEPELDALVTSAANRRVVYTTQRAIRTGRQAVYRLAPWTRDDRIEYLLNADRPRCASVMGRLKESGDEDFLGGIPELWTAVLDRMASDETIGDVRTALGRELDGRISNSTLRFRVGVLCLNAIRKHQLVEFDEVLATEPEEGMSARWLSGSLEGDRAFVRLLRHPPVQLLIAAGWMAEYLIQRGTHELLAEQLPRGLVQEIGRLIAGSVEAQENLKQLLDGNARNCDPMAASLLHAAGVNWQPARHVRPDLHGAYLAGARWIGANLNKVSLTQADLERALLWRANLEEALASEARLSDADLSDANLKACIASGADLSRAVMLRVRADGAVLVGANLTRADLRQASLRNACLQNAGMNGARFCDADLWKASLVDADIEGADFTGANFEDACLKGLELWLARFDKARFGGADLSGCDLEGMELDSPDFHDANLEKALLTDSIMPHANFLGANLREAGLAQVDWPGACLRDANLQSASFHLGTTRSGLVRSPIACEGSRTGFYTDEYGEQDFKNPEEIRKANLRGANLLGANVFNADFYLVDLRDAIYNPGQAEHFRRCGAIL
jgi:uncharacterized protein YjbI with pentapeptide repeats/energy-coupling factor transporter ATP-binding protein EcfA2